jgi:hypothetical protein
VIGGLTDYLQKHSDASVSWSGRYSHLTLDEKGKEKCALALYAMIMERWLTLVKYVLSFVSSIVLMSFS